jgi:hypothetical protein
MSQEESTSWLPQYPELTPLDFFLWGFLKDEVYILPVTITLNNLKDCIHTATVKTDQPLLQNVWHKVKYHLDVCRTTNAAHTEPAQGMKNFTMVCISFLCGYYFLTNKCMYSLISFVITLYITIKKYI